MLQDQGRSAGFHPSGAVVAVGTMTGRSDTPLSMTAVVEFTCTSSLNVCLSRLVGFFSVQN